MSVTENAVARELSQAAVLRVTACSTGGRRAASREQIIADYDVKCPSPAAPMRLLSGGNMQKLILGRVLSQSPRFILANQPTRGLDVGAIAYVHRAIAGGAQARAARCC